MLIPERRPHLLRRRRAGRGRGRDPPAGAGRRPQLVRGRLRRAAADHRPRGGDRRSRDRGVGHRLQRAVASASTPAATWTPPSRPAPTPCTRCSRRSASSTPSSSRSRRWPCPSTAATRLHVYSGGQGVWDDRNQIASRARTCDTRPVTVELVSNGGAFGGKEDMANQAQTALAAWLLQRPVKCTLSREESLLMHAKRHPIRMDYEAGLRRRRHADRAQGAWPSATPGSYASVGMKVLERMAGHASGPYRVPAIDVRVRRRAHQQPGVRGVPRLRRQPGPVRHGGRHGSPRRARSASAAGRSARRNVITPGAVWGPGQIMDDGCLGAAACLDAVRAPLRRGARGRQGRRRRPRPEELRPGQRASRRSPAPSCASTEDGTRRGAPLLDGDGPGRAHRGAPGGRGGARRRPRPDPGHRRHHARARRRPDDGLARHADGRRRR